MALAMVVVVAVVMTAYAVLDRRASKWLVPMSGQRAAMRRRQTAFRWVVVSLSLVFFGLPLFGMLEFTTRDARRPAAPPRPGRRCSTSAPSTTRYPDLRAGLPRLDRAGRR